MNTPAVVPHTQGRWISDHISSILVETPDGNLVCIAEVFSGACGGPRGENWKPEYEANKRLIAAAPELLEALDKAMSLLITHAPHAAAFAPEAFALLAYINGNSADPEPATSKKCCSPLCQFAPYCTCDGTPPVSAVEQEELDYLAMAGDIAEGV